MPKDIEYILKDFVRHVVDLKAEDDPAGSGFHREFRILRELQIQNKNEDKFECEDGKLEENIKKNRYKDIIPRDDRRVKLTEIPGQKGSDYINATFIEDVEGIYGYVAAQGPMPHTANDFWRMLWEYNTEIIFMACRTKEENRPKCEKYWADVGKSSTFGEITIHTESEEEIQDHFIKRHLRAVRDNEVHHLTQFQYTGWPDHNTPSSPDALRCMIEDVRKFRKRLDIPMVVHCSAGCGRTGTIIAIDLAWTMLDKGMIKEEFSMFDIIKSLREQRTSMVQTPDQYEYTHMVMKSLCNEWLAEFTKHDYENVVVDQPVNEAAPGNEQESYYNVGFPGNSGDAVTDASHDKVIQHRNSVRTSKPVTPDKPANMQRPVLGDKQVLTEKSEKPPGAADIVDMRPQRPQPARSSQILKQEQPKLLPDSEVDATARSSLRNKLKDINGERRSFVIDTPVLTKTLAVSSPLPENDSGEYVLVKPTVRPSLISPTSPPPVLPDKKNPFPGIMSLEQSSLSTEQADLHKTFITIGASSQPQITKTGTISVSSTKKQAPKAPSAQTIFDTQQQRSENEGLYSFPDTSKKSATRQPSSENKTVSPTDYENVELQFDHSSLSADLNSPFQSDRDSHKDAPILPIRSYKPEEIEDDSQKPLQNQTCDTNILRQHPSAQTTFLDSRAPQPPTKTHPVLQSVPSSGVQVVALRPAVQPQLIDHRTLDHQPQPGLGRLAAQQPGQDLPGTVRAIGGLPIERQRGGSIKAAKPINAALPTGKDKPLMIATSQVSQSVILTTPAYKPASGKLMAGVEKLRGRIPFHFGQQKGYPPTVSQAPKHRASALPARPRRPAGPRPPPATWSARSQTYL